MAFPLAVEKTRGGLWLIVFARGAVLTGGASSLFFRIVTATVLVAVRLPPAPLLPRSSVTILRFTNVVGFGKFPVAGSKVRLARVTLIWDCVPVSVRRLVVLPVMPE